MKLTSVVTRSNHESDATAAYMESRIANQLRDLLEIAELQGFVITVDTVPNEPLAMGNYHMVGHVRGER